MNSLVVGIKRLYANHPRSLQGQDCRCKSRPIVVEPEADEPLHPFVLGTRESFLVRSVFDKARNLVRHKPEVLSKFSFDCER